MRSSILLLLTLGLAAAGAPSARAGDLYGDGRRTLHGLYTSGFQSGPQRLRAVFTPQADGEWRVEFHFQWSGADRVYSGVAAGSLAHGLLHGRVHNEARTRTFSFRCQFDKKKRCNGRHAEVVRTGEHDTGTITLKE